MDANQAADQMQWKRLIPDYMVFSYLEQPNKGKGKSMMFLG